MGQDGPRGVERDGLGVTITQTQHYGRAPIWPSTVIRSGFVAKVNAEGQKEQILNAAAALFIEKGFGGASMNEIAEALGVTRTAVYYYYKNKEAILVALTDNITRVAAQLAEQAAQHKHLPPRDALRMLV